MFKVNLKLSQAHCNGNASDAYLYKLAYSVSDCGKPAVY